MGKKRCLSLGKHAKKVKIDFAKTFIKQHKKTPNKIQEAWEKRLELFLKDQFYPLLNNHQLAGEYKGHRSINITGDWRAIFIELLDKEGNKVTLFKFIGTHNQLYKR